MGIINVGTLLGSAIGCEVGYFIGHGMESQSICDMEGATGCCAVSGGMEGAMIGFASGAIIQNEMQMDRTVNEKRRD